MKAPLDYSGLASDSRAVRPGYLFAALPGTKADGSAYIADAVKRGAKAVLGLPSARAGAEALGVTFIADDNPRLRLARLAAEFYGAQPRVIAAVTGTNGKTSVSVFLRQIWTQLGFAAASMGTIGVVTPKGEITLAHTTPDPIEVHAILARLAGEGVDHLALEASSHGLDQYRLDGVEVSAAAFTNLTRDHLDYHESFDRYLAAKLRLFSDLLRADGVAVINTDADYAGDFLAVAKARGVKVLTVGESGETIKFIDTAPYADGQVVRFLHDRVLFKVTLPLVGGFQASNALIALGLAVGLGANRDDAVETLVKLKGAPGRMELVAYAASGAPIYVDYAHTPDALETVLTAIRPHTAEMLHVVFGCGGDRDRGKRPLMGAAACRFADRVIVTDDNPRSEDPATIRREALAGCPGAAEIGDRAQAIEAGIAALEAGDVLVIAGKGHEPYQIVGDKTLHFSDRGEAIEAAVKLGGRAA